MIALCTIAKNENKYIREFVEYYKKIGFDKIFLYDNNDEGGEHLEDEIQDYIDSQFIQIINARGMKATPQIPSVQLFAYNHCYENFVKQFKKMGIIIDWIAYFDVDEYLTLPEGMNIKEYLAQEKYKKFDMVHFQWVNYDDNDLVRYDDRPLLERFTRRCANSEGKSFCFNNIHVKTIVRGNLDRIHYIEHPHSPLTYGLCCDAEGKWIRHSWAPYDFEMAEKGIDEKTTAYIKHFGTKTIEEFVWKRMRGFADCPKSESDKVLNANEFFKWNKRTKEKEDLYNKLIGEING